MSIFITDPEFYNKPSCGDSWILLGDAAGHTDPIVAEGIYYAIESAKIASEAIINNDIGSYDSMWRGIYGNFLKERAEFRQKLGILSQSFDMDFIGAQIYTHFTGENNE